MSEPADESLMAGLAAGDAGGLGDLYDRYERPLMAFFLRHGGSVVDAEDGLQEVFLRVLKYQTSYDTRRPFRSWLFRIAHHVALDAAAGRRAADREPSMAPPGADVSGGVRDTLGDIERQRRQIRVREALARLKESDRRVLLLAKVRELRYADVAEILECSEGAVKVRVHRALKRLAAELGDDFEVEGSEAV